MSILQELLKLRKRSEQILVFLSSAAEIKDAIKYFEDEGFGKAYPLLAQ